MQFSRVEARTTGELATEMVMAYELGPEAVVAFARSIGMMDELPRIAKMAEAFKAATEEMVREMELWQRMMGKADGNDD